jgi:hypothetical protein
MEEMPAYIQDVLDLIEWANGPATSKWGAKRAAAGHPEPFGLKYLGVGNEDAITPIFKERFKMIYDAVKAKHPEIVVIGTSGPFARWRGLRQRLGVCPRSSTSDGGRALLRVAAMVLGQSARATTTMIAPAPRSTWANTPRTTATGAATPCVRRWPKPPG